MRYGIDIAAKPDEVFDVLADVARHGEWANPKSSLAVEALDQGEVRVGSRFRSTQKFLGKAARADLTVTAFERPSTLGLEAIQRGKKDQRYHHTFTLTPTPTGTRVERTIETNDVPKLVLTLSSPAIKADAMAALRRLKERLETRRP